MDNKDFTRGLAYSIKNIIIISVVISFMAGATIATAILLLCR